nr:unnamed protein product [Callosobruchus analis]
MVAAALQDIQRQTTLGANTLMLLGDGIPLPPPPVYQFEMRLRKYRNISPKKLNCKIPLQLNCVLVDPPQLNLLIKQGVPEAVPRRDDTMSNTQLRFSSVITAFKLQGPASVLPGGEAGQDTKCDLQPGTLKTVLVSQPVSHNQGTTSKEHDREISLTVTVRHCAGADEKSWLQGFKIPIIFPTSQCRVHKRRNKHLYVTLFIS